MKGPAKLEAWHWEVAEKNQALYLAGFGVWEPRSLWPPLDLSQFHCHLTQLED